MVPARSGPPAVEGATMNLLRLLLELVQMRNVCE